jgi:preprotein translocase subunit SecA
MTGTAREVAGELWQVYGLPMVVIPTNKPSQRRQWDNRFFADASTKWEAIVSEVEKIQSTGRPLLVGTRSVLASERLGQRLAERGLEAKILNATRLGEEADIVSMAGERGRVTIATNMAGRGTDIRLGNGVADLGGLHVIASEWHESGRVDRQLFGRAGRQGDPGSVQAFASLEDELVVKYLPKPAYKILLKASQIWAPGRDKMAALAFRHAQKVAQKAAYKQRRQIMKSDLWLDQALSFSGAETI